MLFTAFPIQLCPSPGCIAIISFAGPRDATICLPCKLHCGFFRLHCGNDDHGTPRRRCLLCWPLTCIRDRSILSGYHIILCIYVLINITLFVTDDFVVIVVVALGGRVGGWKAANRKKTFKKHWQFVGSSAPAHNNQPCTIFKSNAAAGLLYLRCHKPYVMEYLKTFTPDMGMDIGYVYLCLLCAHCV